MMAAFYMSWSVAIARVMERIEGPGGVLSKLEMMGGTTPRRIGRGTYRWWRRELERPTPAR